MKKEEFLDEIKEYKNYIIKTKINDDIFYDKNMNINKENFIFDNYLDYSNLNKSDIRLEDLISDISYNEITIWNEERYKYLTHIVDYIDERINTDFDSFQKILEASIGSYHYDMLEENIEALLKIHYLDLARELVKNSEIENIEISLDEFNELVAQKAEEFCDAEVLNKSVPTEFNEFKEMLNIQKTQKQEETLSL